MGFRNAYEAANYGTRDGAGLFVSIRGKNPTLTVASSTGITYTSNAVIIDSSLMYDLSNIKEGMVIDTMHDTPFSSIVSSVDLANRTIVVEDGWYPKGSTTPSVPASDVGFYVAKITFVWGENTAVHLYDSDETTRGAIAEYDIINDKTGGLIDGLTFLSKSTVKNGHVIRTIIADGAKGFNQFAIIDGCDVAIVDNNSQKTIRKNHNDNNQFLINSQNSEDGNAFNLRNDGRSNRLRGEFRVVSGNGSIENEASNMILLNVNSDTSIFIRNAFGYSGELFYIDNISDYTVTINTRNHGFSEGATASTELRVHAKETILLLSDGTYWQVLIRHSKMKSLGDISTESVITSFGASNYVIAGGAIHVRLFATATSSIANKTKIASLPSGIYAGLGNVAVKTVQGRTAIFTINTDGTITTSSEITNGDQFLLEFSTLVY